MQTGLTSPDKARIIVDRAQAVTETVCLARQGDVILLAGKGHEDYQEINGVRHPSDDRELARNALSALGGGQ